MMENDLTSSPIDKERSRDRSRRGTRFSDGRADGRMQNDRSRERECRRIYVSNVPYEYRWQDLKDLFRDEIGNVTFVELFHDENNKPRGCGVVEFEKSESVIKALEKMNRYDLNGRNLVVKEDYGNERDKFGRIVPKAEGGGGNSGGGGGGMGLRGGGGGDGGSRGSGGGYRDRDDNRMSGGHGNMNDYKDMNFNTYGLSQKFLDGLGVQGPLHTKVFIANLDYKVDAKKLKQVFKLAGKVVSLELSLDKEGNSRGFAVVEYDHPVEAVQAISLFDRQVLFDRRMTVRLDRVPDKSEGFKLPEGLKGIGIGLGPNGEPLRDVARNLPSLQQSNQPQSQQSQMNQMNQVAPAPVAAPANSILGPVPNASNLGTLGNNLAALSTLSSLGGLSNPLLSTAAASLSSLGIGNLGGSNDQNQQQQSNQYNPSSANNYNTGYNTGSGGRSDFDLGGGGGNSNIRNYNTQQNDDFSRGFGSMGNNGSSNNLGRQQNSDTIVIRNLPTSWTWQTLRDKFRDVGEVKFAEIRGQDTGVVRFAKERDAEVAIKLMDGSRFDGRQVDCSFF